MPIDKPKGTNKKQRWAGKSETGWRGFVTCSLKGENKAAFELWAEDHPYLDCLEFITTQLADEYKFTLSFSAEQDCYQAALYGVPNQAPPRCQGLMLTSRAGTPEAAIQGVVFKHVEVVKADYEVGFDPQDKPETRKGSKFID